MSLYKTSSCGQNYSSKSLRILHKKFDDAFDNGYGGAVVNFAAAPDWNQNLLKW